MTILIQIAHSLAIIFGMCRRQNDSHVRRSYDFDPVDTSKHMSYFSQGKIC